MEAHPHSQLTVLVALIRLSYHLNSKNQEKITVYCNSRIGRNVCRSFEVSWLGCMTLVFFLYILADFQMFAWCCLVKNTVWI
jgi:hypothetical protein